MKTLLPFHPFIAMSTLAQQRPLYSYVAPSSPLHEKRIELISMADITTVSAKGIRKQIESLSGRSLEPVKREFDELVMEIYQKITDDVSTSW